MQLVESVPPYSRVKFGVELSKSEKLIINNFDKYHPVKGDNWDNSGPTILNHSTR